MARLPPGRDGVERLYAGARAGVGSARPRGRRLLPGAPSGGVRPRRRHGRPAAARRAAPGLRARPLRGHGGPLPPGLHCRRAGALRRTERRRRARAPAGRLPPHEPRPPRSAGRRLGRNAIHRQGARLGARVLDARERGALRLGAREPWSLRPRSSPGPSTSAPSSQRSWAGPSACGWSRPAWMSRSSGRQPRDVALAALLQEAGRDSAAGLGARSGRRQRRAACGVPSGEAPTVVYVGKLSEEKGVHLLLEALAHVDARAVVVGFGPAREELERARRRTRALHRRPRAPPPPPSLAARGRQRHAVRLSGGLRHGRRRGGSVRRRRRSSRAIRALPRSPKGSRLPIRRSIGHWLRSSPGTPPTWPRSSRRSSRFPAKSGLGCRRPPAQPRSSGGAGRRLPL